MLIESSAAVLRNEMCRCALRVPACVGIALLSIALSNAALAQSTEVVVTGTRPGDATAESGGMVVPRINVGPLGPGDARDQPFSINSIPQALIQEQQAHTPDEALRNDPSVRAFPTQLGFAQNYLIRGFSVGPVYGFYQDGLDLLGYTTPALETDERIDILKGAASVLYGFADPAGVVNFVTKKPLSASLTDVNLGFMSRGTFNGELDASRRFGANEQFGARVDLYGQDGDMAVRRSETQRSSELLSLDWRGDGFKVWVTGQRFKTQRDGGNNVVFLAPIRTRYVIDAPDPRISYGQDFFFQNTEGKIFSGGVDATFGHWTISAAAGHSNDELRSLSSRSQPPVPTRLQPNGNYGVIPAGSGFDDDSDAARASVTRSDAFGSVNNALTIAYSYGEHDIRSYANATADVQLGFTNIYNPVPFAERFPAINPTTDQRIRLSTIIATDRLDLGPLVTLMAGGVRSSYDASVSSVATGAVTSRQVQDEVTPLAAILLHPIPSITAYASYIEALTPGGTAPSTAVNANELLAPFKGKQYELGIKTEPQTGLSINAALFQIEQQISFLNDANVFTADGQQRNRGIEVTIAGRITPQLTLFGGATYIDPRVSNSRTILTGRAIGTAKERASLFLSWDVAAVPGLALQGGGYYVSRYKQQENLPAAVAQGFAQEVYVRSNVTFDFGPRYAREIGGVPLTFRLYGTNVFNKAYWLNPNNNNGLVPGSPRTVRFNVTASF